MGEKMKEKEIKAALERIEEAIKRLENILTRIEKANGSQPRIMLRPVPVLRQAS